MIEEWDEEREERERPEEAVRPEETELDEDRAPRDEKGEQDPSRPGVRRRLRIRDHEEGEEKECSALQAMQRDRQRLAERCGPREQEKRIEAEKRQRDVAPRGPAHDEDSGAGDGEREEGSRSPLARRNPDAAGREHHREQAEVGGIEDVLVVPAKDELRGNRDQRRGTRQEGGIRPEEETEREAGDERAADFDGRETGDARAQELRRDSGADEQGRARKGDVEVKERHAVEKEGREGADLEQARVLSREAVENRPLHSGR